MWTALLILPAPTALAVWLFARPTAQLRETALWLFGATLALSPAVLMVGRLAQGSLPVAPAILPGLGASVLFAGLSGLCLAPLALTAAGRWRAVVHALTPRQGTLLTAPAFLALMPVGNFLGLPISLFVFAASLPWQALLICALVAWGLAAVVISDGRPQAGLVVLGWKAVWYGSLVVVGLTYI